MELQPILLPALASAIGTPLLIYILGCIFRLDGKANIYSDYSDDEAIRRNKSAYNLVGVLFLVGLIVPISFYELLDINENSAWPVALGFIFSVAAPVAFLKIRKIRGGPGFDEFFRYGEIKEGVSRKVQLLLFWVWVLVAFVVACVAIYQSVA